MAIIVRTTDSPEAVEAAAREKGLRVVNVSQEYGINTFALEEAQEGQPESSPESEATARPEEQEAAADESTPEGAHEEEGAEEADEDEEELAEKPEKPDAEAGAASKKVRGKSAARRIAELTKQRRQAEREAQALREELQEIRSLLEELKKGKAGASEETAAPSAEPRGQKPEEAPAPSGPPDISDYDSFDKWVKDYVEYAVKQAVENKASSAQQMEEMLATIADTQRQLVAQQVVREWQGELRERVGEPDPELVERAATMEVPEILSRQIAKAGPVTAYYLAENPKVFEEIAELARQAEQAKDREEALECHSEMLTRLMEAKMAADRKYPRRQDGGARRQLPAQVKTAPQPIKPVAGARAAPVQPDLSQLSTEEYLKVRRDAVRRLLYGE